MSDPKEAAEHLLWRLRNNDTAKHLCGLAADRIAALERDYARMREALINLCNSIDRQIECNASKETPNGGVSVAVRWARTQALKEVKPASESNPPTAETT